MVVGFEVTLPRVTLNLAKIRPDGPRARFSPLRFASVHMARSSTPAYASYVSLGTLPSMGRDSGNNGNRQRGADGVDRVAEFLNRIHREDEAFENEAKAKRSH